MLHIPSKGLGSFKQVMGKAPLVHTKNCHISGPKSYWKFHLERRGLTRRQLQLRDSSHRFAIAGSSSGQQPPTGCTHQVTSPGAEQIQHCRNQYLISYQFTQCTHAILSPFLNFHCTFRPFLILISRGSLQFLYVLYIYKILHVLYCMCIYLKCTYPCLSQAAAVSCCKKFSQGEKNALKSAAHGSLWHMQKQCICDGNINLCTNNWVQAQRAQFERALTLSLCSYLLSFEGMRMFSLELTL